MLGLMWQVISGACCLLSCYLLSMLYLLFAWVPRFSCYAVMALNEKWNYLTTVAAEKANHDYCCIATLGCSPASETLHLAVRSGGGTVEKVYWQWDFV
ncbi:hypothetical protein ACH5RR_004697 [Cinchona calisaya]|uniref:DUF7811 domain-containing protein n=1 Tax=Cinchona calisaya TaxID=153742 RepID=A0ABD3AYF6_9GENT